MRIAIGGIEHETNTYCGSRTPLSAFYVQRGARMLRAAGQESPIGGAVDGCNARGIEPVPLLHAATQPSGTIRHEAYIELRDELLDRLRDAGAIDGVVLLLHGAGVVDGIEDLEGDLAWAVRDVVGPAMPVVATFDLHGNVTQRMADALNGVFACHQYPHVDMHHRADEAVALVARMVEEELRAHCAVVQMPLLLPTTTTLYGVGEQMLENVLTEEAESGVVDISWFHGFPYTDVYHVGSMIVVTGFDGDLEAIGHRVARKLWDMKESFLVESLSAEDAVRQATEIAVDVPNPIVIQETSDNCGGGTPGDGTHVLRAMLEAKLGADACFGFIVDAETAAQAVAAGVGSTINVRLGGKTDDLHGAPIEAQAYVKAISDGRVVLQHMFKGAPLKLGPLVRLVIDDIDVIVASRRSQTFDEEPFLAVGIDVRRYRYVALKSSNHFRACFQTLAGAIITADPPGLTTLDVTVFPRQNTTRRLWPLHEDASF